MPFRVTDSVSIAKFKKPGQKNYLIENSTVVFQDSVVLDGTLHIKDSDVNFNYGIRGGFIETSGETVIHARLSLGSLSKLDGCDLKGKVNLSLSV